MRANMLLGLAYKAQKLMGPLCSLITDINLGIRLQQVKIDYYPLLNCSIDTGKDRCMIA